MVCWMGVVLDNDGRILSDFRWFVRRSSVALGFEFARSFSRSLNIFSISSARSFFINLASSSTPAEGRLGEERACNLTKRFNVFSNVRRRATSEWKRRACSEGLRRTDEERRSRLEAEVEVEVGLAVVGRDGEREDPRPSIVLRLRKASICTAVEGSAPPSKKLFSRTRNT